VFFPDRVSRTFCWGWLWTSILLIPVELVLQVWATAPGFNYTFDDSLFNLISVFETYMIQVMSFFFFPHFLTLCLLVHFLNIIFHYCYWAFHHYHVSFWFSKFLFDLASCFCFMGAIFYFSENILSFFSFLGCCVNYCFCLHFSC
jgi:hypothetical protein